MYWDKKSLAGNIRIFILLIYIKVLIIYKGIYDSHLASLIASTKN